MLKWLEFLALPQHRSRRIFWAYFSGAFSQEVSVPGGQQKGRPVEAALWLKWLT
jgi:hypothetical protein